MTQHVLDNEQSMSIFALATPGLPAAIAIVRVSGADVRRQLQPMIRKALSIPARKVTVAAIHDFENDSVLDRAVVCFFDAPNSYTGENSCEIHLHGSPFVVRRFMQILKSAGLREALAGEFTQRAFLNGKLDLTQAEGINELIHAQTEGQWLAANNLSSGKLASLVESLKDLAIDAMAYLEAQIDFPEEGDTAHLQLVHVDERMANVEKKLQELIATYGAGRVSAQGLKVALIGEPNAGKSTLLNALLNEERAIVTDIPGTTRDYIEESCIIGGKLFRLIDTAGIRETTDQVEVIGVERSYLMASQSDVILALMPSTGPDDASAVFDQMRQDCQGDFLIVKTMVDRLENDHDNVEVDIEISAKTGAGMEQLKSKLVESYDRLALGATEQNTFITNERQLHCLNLAQDCLLAYRSARNEGAFAEVLAFEVRSLVSALESMIGKVDVEDVLDRVFGEFCVGK